MRKLIVTTTTLALLGLGWAPGAAHAKSAVQCKPAITGWGSHSFAHKAKSKAIASYKAKAAAAYGKIVWNIKIGDHCTKLQKGLGWQCWFKAQPCVDGGLKPSIQRSPHAKAPRYRVKARMRVTAKARPKSISHRHIMPLRNAPKVRTMRAPRSR